MKKALLYIALILTDSAQAQTASVFSFQPVSSQRIHAKDSAQLFATLISSSAGTPTITWTQVTGPTVTITPTTNLIASWTNGAVITGSFWVSNLPTGQYIWKATGLSSAGTTGSVYDTLNVIATPAPRTVSTFVIPLPGQNITISASALPSGFIKFNDGTNQ